MKYSAFLIVLCFYSSLIQSQVWTPAGARSAAMGSVSAAMSDFWSSQNNQAGMAFLERAGTGIYYENHFLIKELASNFASVTIPTRHGSFAFNTQYSGDPIFSTLKSGTAFAMKMGNRIAVGIQLDYMRTRLSDIYGARGMFTFETGLMARISEQLTFGVHIFNPLHIKLSESSNERIPMVLNSGFCYSFSEELLVAAEIFKNTALPPEIRAGAEYKFFRKGYARLGMSTNPFRYAFGFGLEYSRLSLDISSSVHETLGVSPQASLQISLGK